MTRIKTSLERFLMQAEVLGGCPVVSCWRWTGARNDTGYGVLGLRLGHRHYRNARAHRWAYKHFVGPIADGLHLDHLCRNRWCVNPLHLEPVTPAENVLRGVGFSAVNARKTHCKRGHAFDDANTWIDKHGYRHCRTCRSAQISQWQKNNRDRRLAQRRAKKW